MTNLSPETDVFIAEFDAAIEAHMEWTRRILRCAVLRISPGEDVMTPMAHTLCRFGSWFTANIQIFEVIDAGSVRRIEVAHKSMHDAIRSICNDVMNAQPGGVADLELFEKSQSELLTLLANLKTFVISHAAQIDPLTELPLRHNIESEFTRCQKDAIRNNTLLYIAMIDIDNFKSINDRYGHPVGDKVLRHLARTLKLSLRGNDHLYRYGGEEFLWLMRCQYAEQAEQSARRTVISIRTTPVPIGVDTPLNVSITIGLVQVGEREEITSALKRADFALYEGKKSGRDRYVIGYT
jgi:diguanylate cyclase